jgi:glycosyltransferase involved in cell wall biosynthesis
MQKEKKRLMILIWDMGIGGVQKRVKDILIDIGNNNPEWEVYLLIKRRLPSYHIEEIRNKTDTNIHYFFFTGSYGRSKSIYALIWIVKSYLQIKPHVVLTFLDHLSIIMVTLKHLVFWQKTKLVLNEGILTSDYLKIYRKKVWLWKFLVKLMYPLADRIIVPTKAIKKDLSENFGVPKSKITIVNNWTLLKPTLPSKPLYDLIFIGRLATEKNPLALIEIVVKLEEEGLAPKLAILGSGMLEKEIRKSIEDKNLQNNIKILGFKRNVVPYLRKSKILVLTTINEGMPNVVLEAFTCAVPAVSMCFPGGEEIIKHGENGFLAHSQKQMIIQIKKLLKDEALRKKVGERAQEVVVKNFSKDNQKKFIEALLN